MRITVSGGFEDHMHLSYSKTEVVKSVNESQHPPFALNALAHAYSSMSHD